MAVLSPPGAKMTSFATEPASVVIPTSCWKMGFGTSEAPKRSTCTISRKRAPEPKRLRKMSSAWPSPVTSRTSKSGSIPLATSMPISFQ